MNPSSPATADKGARRSRDLPAQHHSTVEGYRFRRSRRSLFTLPDSPSKAAKTPQVLILLRSEFAEFGFGYCAIFEHFEDELLALQAFSL
jgi:hypothetical protein